MSRLRTIIPKRWLDFSMFQLKKSNTSNNRVLRCTTTINNNNNNRCFQKKCWYNTTSGESPREENEPGSRAFADCEKSAVMDLFHHYANIQGCGGVDSTGKYLTFEGIKLLLESIGEQPNDETMKDICKSIDLNQDGKYHLEEFLLGSDKVLGGLPARVILVVGGPGSGKGLLCSRLVKECDVYHVSTGDMLRDEIEKETPLGKEVSQVMKRGELVSSCVIMSLLRRRIRNFPRRRILLDGFPRSLQNAIDFKELCGKPELALHLKCDDTYLIERIVKRARDTPDGAKVRIDDNIETALERLRTFHKFHDIIMEWLRQERIPLVDLDVSGTPENVWNQLEAIGRLMRPVTQL